MIRNFDDIRNLAKSKEQQIVSVAAAGDKDVLNAVKKAELDGILKATLVGDENEIKSIAKEIDYDLKNATIIHADTPEEACQKAVLEVTEKRAQVVMKGLVDTSVILKAILKKEANLRTGRVLSHVACFDLKSYEKILLVTDAAMNIAPGIMEKKQIIQNSVELARALDIDKPKVAVLCAKEKVNPKMPATVDAKELADMNTNGEIENCLVGGPFALDNAVSKQAAKHKGIDHPVAGDADILMVPDIEAGNILYKALAFLAEGSNAGVIVGSKVPIVLTSRADSDEAKFNSIALAVLMAANSK